MKEKESKGSIRIKLDENEIKRKEGTYEKMK